MIIFYKYYVLTNFWQIYRIYMITDINYHIILLTIVIITTCLPNL